MYLKSLELSGFKSFAKKAKFEFKTPITAIVGPNGSGKSNVAEAFRFVLGEQKMTQMRSKRTEDLIWSGSAKIGRSSRAQVSLVFNNQKRLLDIDFDEVSIERTIHRDSSTDYALNGSPVRLRDIIELLAGAHVGSSGHHIISQGETDRILNVNARERKEMVEEALGLKIYQFKKEESIKKLEKTEQNIREVESLRREIKPHLKFLSSQVKKIEKVHNQRDELTLLYKVFFGVESVYIESEKKRISEGKTPLELRTKALEEKLSKAKQTLEELDGESEKTREILSVEENLSRVRKEKDELTRDIGRIEGAKTALENTMARAQKEDERARVVSMGEVEGLARDIKSRIDRAENENDVGVLKNILREIRETFSGFLERVSGVMPSSTDDDSSQELENLGIEHKELSKKLQSLEESENKFEKRYKELKRSVDEGRDSGREAERAMFAVTTEQNEVRIQLNALIASGEKLKLEEEEFERERVEARALVGEEGVVYSTEGVAESREQQNERRKKVERLKIRLEDSGGGSGEEVIKEYEEVSERDAFLERELLDLDVSSKSLKQLIVELDERLKNEFEKGLNKINEHFQELFEVTFGGGTARLDLMKERTRKRSDIELARMVDDGIGEEDEIMEAGIDVAVSLPRKRVKGLQMLSGGERALTSIALLFAMSRVNPPPFVLLDETDAALDEANSRRYGDMVEKLAEESQLILITHNRETMSRAGVLYGITMGSDGVSQLLSVDFEEAIKVAK